MNDPTSPDDEIASSYLDGEATLDELARFEAESALHARAEELRAAKELVATPVEPLPPHRIDRILDAALDAGATSDDVIDLRAAAIRRQQVRQRLVTVAAAVLVIALAVPVLFALDRATDDGDDGQDFATEADESDGDDREPGEVDGDGDGDAVALGLAEADVDTAPAAADPDNGGGDADMAADGEAVGPGARGIMRAEILPDDLGAGDEFAVIDAVSTAWSEYLARPDVGPTPADFEELAELYPCVQEILDRAGGPAVTGDFGLATFDGEPVTIAVVDVDGESAALLTAPHGTCQVEEVAIVR